MKVQVEVKVKTSNWHVCMIAWGMKIESAKVKVKKNMAGGANNLRNGL